MSNKSSPPRDRKKLVYKSLLAQSCLGSDILAPNSGFQSLSYTSIPNTTYESPENMPSSIMGTKNNEINLSNQKDSLL